MCSRIRSTPFSYVAWSGERRMAAPLEGGLCSCNTSRRRAGRRSRPDRPPAPRPCRCRGRSGRASRRRRSGSPGRPGPSVGHRHRRLQLRDVVVGEVADDGSVELLRLLEGDEPRAGADEGVAAEPSLLDRLEQEARRGALAQPQVRPEGGQQVGGDVGVRVMERKTTRQGRGERSGLWRPVRPSACSRVARGARPSRCGRSSASAERLSAAPPNVKAATTRCLH